MSEPFIGEIRAVSWNLVPRGWALCNGQLMSIAQNQALFSILGTTYGGDGVTTFALPNLQGRVPIGTGNGVVLGESAGQATHTLLTTEMPAHMHTLNARPTPGQDSTNAGELLAGANGYGPPSSLTTLAPQAVGAAGGSQPHENMQPYLVVNYLIALTGLYPSRN